MLDHVDVNEACVAAQLMVCTCKAIITSEVALGSAHPDFVSTVPLSDAMVTYRIGSDTGNLIHTYLAGVELTALSSERCCIPPPLLLIK